MQELHWFLQPMLSQRKENERSGETLRRRSKMRSTSSCKGLPRSMRNGCNVLGTAELDASDCTEAEAEEADESEGMVDDESLPCSEGSTLGRGGLAGKDRLASTPA